MTEGTDGMSNDRAGATLDPGVLSPQTLYRGLYVRIADKLSVDPSYVSRVARGERQSRAVERALRGEIDQINKKLSSKTGSKAKMTSAAKPAGKRLQHLVINNRDGVRKNWIQQIQSDPNIKRIKLSSTQRVSPFTPLINEALRAMKLDLKAMSKLPMKAAAAHGRLRREQGYSLTALLEEYNLVRRCIFDLAKEHTGQIDPNALIHDLSQVGEALDLQMQSAMRTFAANAQARN
jgi:RsbRD-like negative regulator of sigma factor